MSEAARTSVPRQPALRGLRARALAGLGRAARAVVPGMRRVNAQVAPYAAAWEEHNRAVLAGRAAGGGRRLWVALGDSTAQGIGATAPTRGYVGQLLALLGPDWEVVNLSRSGIRLAGLRADLLPRLGALGPADLVTCAVGANDLIPTPLDVIVVELHALLADLPPASVVATVPQGLRPPKATAFNDVVHAEAPAAGLRVADVWARTGPPWRGRFASDGFHPNDAGYELWTAAFAAALGLGEGRGQAS